MKVHGGGCETCGRGRETNYLLCVTLLTKQQTCPSIRARACNRLFLVHLPLLEYEPTEYFQECSSPPHLFSL